jgi:hypothetical protein
MSNGRTNDGGFRVHPLTIDMSAVIALLSSGKFRALRRPRTEPAAAPEFARAGVLVVGLPGDETSLAFV